VTDRLEFEVNGTYEESPEYSGFSVFATLNFRFTERSNGRAEYDSRYERGRLAYSTFQGQDVGAWDVSLDANHARRAATSTRSATTPWNGRSSA
jgi:hypothetical protein